MYPSPLDWLQANPSYISLLIVIVVWTLFWKALALWHSARREQLVWFTIMLIVNTLGILEIIYLFFVAKLKWSELFKNED